MYNNDYEEIVAAPSSCNGSAEAWSTGMRLVSLVIPFLFSVLLLFGNGNDVGFFNAYCTCRYIKQDSFLGGKTGKLGFDESGDRLFAEYNIINVVNRNRQLVGNFTYSKARF